MRTTSRCATLSVCVCVDDGETEGKNKNEY